MRGDYITYSAARLTQADTLSLAIATIATDVRALAAAGTLQGAGPVFVGIGASFAAAAAPVWTLRSRGIHSWRMGAGDHPVPYPASEHPIIGISQSGKSTETIAVLSSVAEDRRWAVVNADPSPVSNLASTSLSLGCIPDSYASTIGYTATIVALGMIAEAWDGGEISPDWEQLPDLFRRTEREVEARADELAASFDGVAAADFVGAGPSVGSAAAAALLFREVARVHAAGMSTREYLHGSMESAGDSIHVIFGDEREREVATTLSRAGHRVILVTSGDVEEEPNLQCVRIPEVSANARAILEVLVAQILVERVAGARGIDVEEFVFHNDDTKVVVE